ncbi:MAG TPA: phosphoribosylglycinamide formyltransferase, partial [Gammaproteobacteria bacterium]|nr:phosphoribosylglycinamide formyltransferase [Gammaproteobacteria bacterium]
MKPCRIVVLISGSGSNLQALIDKIRAGEINGEVVAVISNRPGVKGLERARKAGIPALTIDHKEYPSREAFDEALAETIDRQQPDLIVLAGFMRILTPDFVNHYTGRMLNIHPSLLPKYQGLHTHKRALEAGDKEHGA